jgi:hypothetical protein
LQLGEEVIELQVRKELRSAPSARFHQRVLPDDDAS